MREMMLDAVNLPVKSSVRKRRLDFRFDRQPASMVSNAVDQQSRIGRVKQRIC